MLTFFVRLLFFLLLARVAFVVLRGLGLVGAGSRPRRRPEVPPGTAGGPPGSATGGSAPSPGASAPGLGGDIVDAEFEDLPNAGEH